MRHALILWVAAAAIAEAQPAPVTLVPGETVERRLARDGKHVYLMTLDAGEYAHLSIDQRGAETVVRIASPEGAEFGMETLAGPAARLSVPLLAGSAGVFRIELSPDDSAEESGGYSIRWNVRRQPSAADRAAADAYRKLCDAVRVFRASTTGDARKQSIAISEQSLALWREAGDAAGQLVTLLFLGDQWRAAGSYREVAVVAEQAVEIARRTDAKSAEAVALNQLGLARVTLGASQEGLEQMKSSLRIWTALNHAFGLAYIHSQLGHTYANIGDWRSAGVHLRLAAQHARVTRDPMMAASSLISLARIQSKEGAHKDAIASLEESLKYYAAKNDLRNQAYIASQLGDEYVELGDNDRAFAEYDKAVSFARKTGDAATLANALLDVAAKNARSGQHEKALALMKETLALNRASGRAISIAESLGLMASVEREMGRLAEARQHSAEAVNVVESLRARIASGGLRAASMAARVGAYSMRIRVLHKSHLEEPGKGFDTDAFAVSERSRARGFLDMITEAKVDIREGVDPRLLSEEASIIGEIQAKSRDRSPKAVAEIEELVARHDALEARIRQASPRYASVSAPPPLTVARVQSELLDENTALLEYHFAPRSGYAWVITKQAVAMESVADGAKVAPLARAVHAKLTARNERVKGESPVQRSERVAKADTELAAALDALRAAVFDPIAKHIRTRRLLVVSDGALDYVPFSLLATELEVVHLPSASVLALIREQTAKRKAAERGLAIFADPVFDAADTRVSGKAAQGGGQLREEVATLRSEEDGRIPRLLFTRREAEAIASAVPASWRPMKATGFAASREAVLDPELARYRILHFATHGVLNNEVPELSGLVFSMVDAKGKPTDGFIRLRDIYRMRLGADLVVLSACQTALGKEMRGEGLIGLTRGAMFAGAARVMASLWKVDDAATAELMKYFYESLGKGSPAATALRDAQQRLRKQPRWQSPYYWAAFILQGEYR